MSLAKDIILSAFLQFQIACFSTGFKPNLDPCAGITYGCAVATQLSTLITFIHDLTMDFFCETGYILLTRLLIRSLQSVYQSFVRGISCLASRRSCDTYVDINTLYSRLPHKSQARRESRSQNMPKVP